MDRPLVFFFLERSFSVDPFILGVGTEEKTSCGTPGGEEGGCGGGAGFDGEDFRDVDDWDLSVGNLFSSNESSRGCLKPFEMEKEVCAVSSSVTYRCLANSSDSSSSFAVAMGSAVGNWGPNEGGMADEAVGSPSRLKRVVRPMLDSMFFWRSSRVLEGEYLLVVDDVISCCCLSVEVAMGCSSASSR